MSFKKIASELGELLEQKNKNYGSAFLKIEGFLKLLYPKGIKPENYIYAMLIVRIFDKLMRISQGALDESFKDIAGYAILGISLSIPKVLPEMSEENISPNPIRPRRLRPKNFES